MTYTVSNTATQSGEYTPITLTAKRETRSSKVPRAWPESYVCKTRSFDKFVLETSERIKAFSNPKGKADYVRNLRLAVRQLALNCYVTYKRSQKLYLVVTTSKHAYGLKGFMGQLGFTQRATRDAILGLSRLGYIHDELEAFYNRETGVGMPACYKPSSELIREMEKYLDLSDIRQKPILKTVLLKRRKQKKKTIPKAYEIGSSVEYEGGRILKYKADDSIKQQRKDIVAYNKLIDSSDIGFHHTYRDEIPCEYLPNILTNQTYRIYTRDKDYGDFSCHGRFYGPWWEQIKSTLRNRITILGERTIELDYRTIHPALLYVELGIDYRSYAKKHEGYSDIYGSVLFPTLQGNEKHHRNLAKKLLNAAINSKDRSDAIKAALKTINYDKEVARYSSNPDYHPTYAEMSGNLDLVLKQHPLLESYLYKGYGLKLMHYDSMMAEYIMRHFTYNLKEPVLMVHDSFLVRECMKDELQKIMCAAFKYVASIINPNFEIPYSPTELIKLA